MRPAYHAIKPNGIPGAKMRKSGPPVSYECFSQLGHPTILGAG